MRNTEKKVRGNGIEQNGIRVLKALLCAYVLTGILLLLLTGLLYKWNLDEGKVTAGIIVIYVVSTFIGGFMIGKMSGDTEISMGTGRRSVVFCIAPSCIIRFVSLFAGRHFRSRDYIFNVCGRGHAGWYAFIKKYFKNIRRCAIIAISL